MTTIEIKTKMVPKRYIELPYDEKTWISISTLIGTRVEPAGVVEIYVDELYEFWDHGKSCTPGFDSAYIGFSPQEERALEKMGWADGATRGGVWPTKAFNEWMDEKNIV